MVKHRNIHLEYREKQCCHDSGHLWLEVGEGMIQCIRIDYSR